MRFEVPAHGATRVKKKFLIFPTHLWHSPNEERWLEFAAIRETYSTADGRWNKVGWMIDSDFTFWEMVKHLIIAVLKISIPLAVVYGLCDLAVSLGLLQALSDLNLPTGVRW